MLCPMSSPSSRRESCWSQSHIGSIGNVGRACTIYLSLWMIMLFNGLERPSTRAPNRGSTSLLPLRLPLNLRTEHILRNHLQKDIRKIRDGTRSSNENCSFEFDRVLVTTTTSRHRKQTFHRQKDLRALLVKCILSSKTGMRWPERELFYKFFFPKLGFFHVWFVSNTHIYFSQLYVYTLKLIYVAMPSHRDVE